jgi:peptidoglycan hydrolase-like protein with peptidoglycan-binding domain
MDPFDELAQSLARGVSRRTALRRFAGGLGAVLVATVLPWKSPAVASALSLYVSGVSVSGASVPSAPTGASNMASVQIGASGPRVEAMQYLLRLNGADIEVDGDFGEQTDQAVHAFQQKNDLTVDGLVGPETWGALFVAVQKGDQGDAVSAVQTLLNMQGQDVEIDGDFGDQTEGAVKAFQKAKRLTANGIVGPQTWAALVGN